MTSDLFIKLRQWERDDKAETIREIIQSKYRDGIEQYKTLISRLDILLGASVASLLFCVGILFVHVFGLI